MWILKNLSKEKIERIKATIQENPNITYAFFDNVSYNLVFVCAFKSSSGFVLVDTERNTSLVETTDVLDYCAIGVRDHKCHQRFEQGTG